MVAPRYSHEDLAAWHVKLAVNSLLNVLNEQVPVLISNVWMLFAKDLKFVLCTYNGM